MIRGGELRREFHLNLRCGGTRALVAMLSLLPPWVRAWAISVSTLWLFFCVCKKSFWQFGFYFSCLQEEQSSKSPWVYQRCFKQAENKEAWELWRQQQQCRPANMAKQAPLRRNRVFVQAHSGMEVGNPALSDDFPCMSKVSQLMNFEQTIVELDVLPNLRKNQTLAQHLQSQQEIWKANGDLSLQKGYCPMQLLSSLN